MPTFEPNLVNVLYHLILLVIVAANFWLTARYKREKPPSDNGK